MAPAVAPRPASSFRTRTLLSRSVSPLHDSLSPRNLPSKTPVASLFAVIIKGAVNLSRRTLQAAVLSPRSAGSDAIQPVFLRPSSPSLAKRQNAVLAIPTTYAGLNAGPQPGAVVGIVLGSILGFVLVLYILLSAARLSGYWGRETIIEEEVVRARRQPVRTSTRTRTTTEVRIPRRDRPVEDREEDEVIVEPSVESDEIVEVIEEESSPERPPKPKPKRSGFRTVDPAEFGGGNRPTRKISRR